MYEFFVTLELHKSRIIGQEKIGKTNLDIALAIEPMETDSDFSMDGNHEAYLKNKMKNFWILTNLIGNRQVNFYERRGRWNASTKTRRVTLKRIIPN